MNQRRGAVASRSEVLGATDMSRHPSAMGEAESDLAEGSLAVLFLAGSLERDGRARRTISAINELGIRTVVVDGAIGCERRRLRILRIADRLVSSMRQVAIALKHASDTSPAVAISAGHLSLAPAWMAARLLGVPLIYDAYEYFDLVPRDEVLSRLRRRMVLTLCRRADAVLAANPERADLMLQNYGITTKPSVVRNVPISPAVSKAVNPPQWWTEIPQGSKVVLYQGYVDPKRGLERFVEAVPYLPTNYQLVLAGDGPHRAYLERLAASLGVGGQVTWAGAMDHEELVGITPFADVGLVAYSNQGLNNLYCAPSKFFEYVQAGVPVVATRQPALESIAKGHEGVVFIEHGDTPKSVAEAIRGLADRGVASHRHGLRTLAEDFPWERESAALQAVVLESLRRGETQ